LRVINHLHLSSQNINKYYPIGADINSEKTVSIRRKEELNERKSRVINDLNETYTEDQREEDSNKESEDYYDHGDDTELLLIKEELMKVKNDDQEPNLRDLTKELTKSRVNNGLQSELKDSQSESAGAGIDKKDINSEFINDWMIRENLLS